MSEAPKPPKKPPPMLAGLYGPDYAVEKYDFQRWTTRNPPDIDADPIIREFPMKKAPRN